MREHEVPTHVQAEDKVLLWFTFPQIVAVTAVGALAYGIYNYAPIPSSEVRIGLAVLFALAGLAAIVGRVGGRRLPLVAADLLQYRLGGRCYAGTPAELARSEPPAPSNDNPGLIQQMAEKTRHRLRRLRRKPRSRERKNGRMPLRPQRWLRNRRKPRDRGNGKRRTCGDAAHRTARRSGPVHTDRGGRIRPSNSGPDARVGTGPRHPLSAGRARTAGGTRSTSTHPTPSPDGGSTSRVSPSSRTGQRSPCGPPPTSTSACRHSAAPVAGSCASGERQAWRRERSIFYTLPLSGDAPSFTFAWVDTSGQAGAVSLKGEQTAAPPAGRGGGDSATSASHRSAGARARSPGCWSPGSASTPWSIPSTSSWSTVRSTSRGRWS